MNVYDERHGRFRDFDAEAGAMIEALGLDGASRVLDIGCGTGELTVRLARVCRAVTAVDVSPLMIEVVRRKCREQGIDNLTVVQGGLFDL